MGKGGKSVLLVVVWFIVAGAAGCTPALKKEAQQPEEALRPVRFFSPEFNDDMARDSLTVAIRRNLEYLGGLGPDTVFHYGPHDFTCRQVRESQEAFLGLVSRGLDADRNRAATCPREPAPR